MLKQRHLDKRLPPHSPARTLGSPQKCQTSPSLVSLKGRRKTRNISNHKADILGDTSDTLSNTEPDVSGSWFPRSQDQSGGFWAGGCLHTIAQHQAGLPLGNVGLRRRLRRKGQNAWVEIHGSPMPHANQQLTYKTRKTTPSSNHTQWLRKQATQLIAYAFFHAKARGKELAIGFASG